MRSINKGPSPDCLGQFRRELRAQARTTNTAPTAQDWVSGERNQPIRDALWRDQQGLCAYCTQRIKVHGHRDTARRPQGNAGMRIEHIEPRETAPERMYDWDNLMGVCGGRCPAVEPGITHYDHCDRTRGAQQLDIDPTRHPVDAWFDYQRCEGGLALVVRPDYAPDAQALQAQVDAVLQLNNPTLLRYRRIAEQQIAKAIRQNPRRLAQTLRRFLQLATDPHAQLPDFAPVVARYVAMRMRRNGITP